MEKEMLPTRLRLDALRPHDPLRLSNLCLIYLRKNTIA
jgi:hypothetical protein